MRHVVNFGLLFAFFALSVTGVMAFTFPFSTTTARVHIVAGMCMIVLVVLHMAGRLPYFRSQITKGKKPPLSHGKLAAVITVAASSLAVALLALPPASWLIDQSYEARNSAQIIRSSSLTGVSNLDRETKLIVRDIDSRAGRPLSVHLSFRDHVSPVPSVAAWAETTNGTMIETLFLDESLAFVEKVDWHGSLVQRDHILPIWRNRYTAISGVDGSGKVDATTGATDTHSFALDPYLVAGEGKKFVVCVEINAPSDPDDIWQSADLGQPSLLYTALVKVDAKQRYQILDLTAYGSPGKGELRYDLERVSTAKRLVDLFLLKLEDGDVRLAD
jgi:hypothetical protein